MNSFNQLSKFSLNSSSYLAHHDTAKRTLIPQTKTLPSVEVTQSPSNSNSNNFDFEQIMEGFRQMSSLSSEHNGRNSRIAANFNGISPTNLKSEEGKNCGRIKYESLELIEIGIRFNKLTVKKILEFQEKELIPFLRILKDLNITLIP